MHSIFVLYLDDVTNAYWKKRRLVISDRYFGEGMETNGAKKKVKKERKDKNLLKNCVYTQYLNIFLLFLFNKLLLTDC